MSRQNPEWRHFGLSGGQREENVKNQYLRMPSGVVSRMGRSRWKRSRPPFRTDRFSQSCDTDSFTPEEFHIYRDGVFTKLPLGKDGRFEGDPEDSQITQEVFDGWMHATKRSIPVLDMADQMLCFSQFRDKVCWNQNERSPI